MCICPFAKFLSVRSVLIDESAKGVKLVPRNTPSESYHHLNPIIRWVKSQLLLRKARCLPPAILKRSAVRLK